MKMLPYIFIWLGILQFTVPFNGAFITKPTNESATEYGVDDENISRVKRIARGYIRGQTQSQYLNFGKPQQDGKAEAEATESGSRSTVSGTYGMGQAQSQFSASECSECGPTSIYEYSSGTPSHVNVLDGGQAGGVHRAIGAPRAYSLLPETSRAADSGGVISKEQPGIFVRPTTGIPAKIQYPALSGDSRGTDRTVPGMGLKRTTSIGKPIIFEGLGMNSKPGGSHMPEQPQNMQLPSVFGPGDASQLSRVGQIGYVPQPSGIADKTDYTYEPGQGTSIPPSSIVQKEATGDESSHPSIGGHHSITHSPSASDQNFLTYGESGQLTRYIGSVPAKHPGGSQKIGFYSPDKAGRLSEHKLQGQPTSPKYQESPASPGGEIQPDGGNGYFSSKLHSPIIARNLSVSVPRTEPEVFGQPAGTYTPSVSTNQAYPDSQASEFHVSGVPGHVAGAVVPGVGLVSDPLYGPNVIYGPLERKKDQYGGQDSVLYRPGTHGPEISEKSSTYYSGGPPSEGYVRDSTVKSPNTYTKGVPRQPHGYNEMENPISVVPGPHKFLTGEYQLPRNIHRYIESGDGYDTRIGYPSGMQGTQGTANTAEPEVRSPFPSGAETISDQMINNHPHVQVVRPGVTTFERGIYSRFNPVTTDPARSSTPGVQIIYPVTQQLSNDGSVVRVPQGRFAETGQLATSVPLSVLSEGKGPYPIGTQETILKVGGVLPEGEAFYHRGAGNAGGQIYIPYTRGSLVSSDGLAGRQELYPVEHKVLINVPNGGLAGEPGSFPKGESLALGGGLFPGGLGGEEAVSGGKKSYPVGARELQFQGQDHSQQRAQINQRTFVGLTPGANVVYPGVSSGNGALEATATEIPYSERVGGLSSGMHSSNTGGTVGGISVGVLGPYRGGSQNGSPVSVRSEEGLQRALLPNGSQRIGLVPSNALPLEQILTPTQSRTSSGNPSNGTGGGEEKRGLEIPFSQAESAVEEGQASASAQGKMNGGTAQTQVFGSYSSSGTFSASAMTSDNERSANAQVSGGLEGAMSQSQGQGGAAQSQAQIQVNTKTGDAKASSQSGGVIHQSQNEVQANERGGLADAQSSGPGQTSSQAQIGFRPKQDEGSVIPSSSGGGQASAQSYPHSGQSQSQIHGKSRFGIAYHGAAQSASGTKEQVATYREQNRELFHSIRDFGGTESAKDHADTAYKGPTLKADPEKEPNMQLKASKISKDDVKGVDKNEDDVSALPEDDDEDIQQDDYDDAEDYYIDNSFIISKRSNVSQTTANPTSASVSKTETESTHHSVSQGKLTHALPTVLGSALDKYTIPQNENGHVHRTRTTTELVPNGFHGSVNVEKKFHTKALQPQKVNNNSATIIGGSEGANQPKLQAPDSYITVTKSIAGSMDNVRDPPQENKNFQSTYYTKSSTCGYFTFSCNIVYGVHGRSKICRPKTPTNGKC